MKNDSWTPFLLFLLLLIHSFGYNLHIKSTVAGMSTVPSNITSTEGTDTEQAGGFLMKIFIFSTIFLSIFWLAYTVYVIIKEIRSKFCTTFGQNNPQQLRSVPWANSRRQNWIGNQEYTCIKHSFYSLIIHPLISENQHKISQRRNSLSTKGSIDISFTDESKSSGIIPTEQVAHKTTTS